MRTRGRGRGQNFDDDLDGWPLNFVLTLATGGSLLSLPSGDVRVVLLNCTGVSGSIDIFSRTMWVLAEGTPHFRLLFSGVGLSRRLVVDGVVVRRSLTEKSGTGVGSSSSALISSTIISSAFTSLLN